MDWFVCEGADYGEGLAGVGYGLVVDEEGDGGVIMDVGDAVILHGDILRTSYGRIDMIDEGADVEILKLSPDSTEQRNLPR